MLNTVRKAANELREAMYAKIAKEEKSWREQREITMNGKTHENADAPSKCSKCGSDRDYRPFKCEICGQGFRQTRGLDAHRGRVHKKEKVKT